MKATNGLHEDHYPNDMDSLGGLREYFFFEGQI
jgi:hypothetical protein